MHSLSELSKSRHFTVISGTVVDTEQSSADYGGPERLTADIIDQKYEILDLLGEGGMGAVFLAHHLLLDKDVALKTFKTAALTDEARTRFQREAQAIAKLNHQNIIQVFDFGLCEDGVPYYTMQYLRGQSLAEKIQNDGPLPAALAIESFIPICEGLKLAHSKGIIHRDLKPANIFIETIQTAKGTTESFKIVDFGIATLTDQGPERQRLTSVGTIFGSPLYMSPEQAAGTAMSEHTDIYSLGCTLFEALTGKPPFRGETAVETLMLHQVAEPPTLKAASGGKDFPPGLELTVATMLAKDPEDRHPSMAYLAEDLAKVGRGKNIADYRIVKMAEQAAKHSDGEALAHRRAAERNRQKYTTRLPLTAAAALLVIGVVGSALWAVKKAAIQQPNAQGPIVSTKITKPTHTTETGPNGRTYEVFKFSPELELGVFRSRYEETTGNKPISIGQAKWPTGSPITFQPTPEFLEHPANLGVFKPDYLDGLDLRKGALDQTDDAVMSYVWLLTGLKSLILDDCNMADTDIKSLDKLTHLEDLSLSRTRVTGGGIAQMHRLLQLRTLSMQSCQQVHKLLAALDGSNKLQALDLDNSRLSQADFEHISTLRQLQMLTINGCGMTDPQFALLASSLPMLTHLKAGDFIFTDQSFEPLKRMQKNGLVTLMVSAYTPTGKKLELREQAKISHIIPQVDFHNGGVETLHADPDIDWTGLTKRVK